MNLSGDELSGRLGMLFDVHVRSRACVEEPVNLDLAETDWEEMKSMFVVHMMKMLNCATPPSENAVGLVYDGFVERVSEWQQGLEDCRQRLG